MLSWMRCGRCCKYRPSTDCPLYHAALVLLIAISKRYRMRSDSSQQATVSSKRPKDSDEGGIE